MLLESLVRAAHFIGIMVLYAALLAAHLSTARSMPRRLVRRVATLDLVCGLAAAVVLATGLLQWFAVGKPAAYYTGNGLFHGKLTLFVVAGLLAIKPACFWRRHRAGDPDDAVAVPGSIKGLQGAQLLVLILLPILASLIARGIGAG